MTGFQTDFLDDVRQVDILDVISSAVELKAKSGRFWACCPFHSENTPSFSVSPQKGFFHCFGCHESGDVISFVQKFEGLDFMEAVKRIAESHGIPVPQFKPKHAREEAELFEMCDDAVRFFEQQLPSSESLKVLEERGFSEETAHKWRLGHAGVSLVSRYKDRHNVLVKAGLASVYQRRVVDMFYNRLMFPITDGRGNYVTLAGRALSDKGAKYKNGRDSRVFHKGRTVYGFGMSEPHFKEEGFAVLVEGYTDVIRLHQDGLKVAVASMGTAFTPQHARALSRRVERVVVMTDGDRAGRLGAVKSTAVLYEAGLDPVVCVMPDGEDPDSYTRKHGIDGARKLIDDAVDGVDFFVEAFVASSNMKTAASRAKASSQLVEKVARFQEESVRLEIFERFSKHAMVRPELLEEQVSAVIERSSAPREGVSRRRLGKALRAEAYLLGLLLQSRDRLDDFKKLLDRALMRNFRIYPIVNRLESGGWTSIGALLGETSNPDTRVTIEAAASISEDLLNSMTVKGCWDEMKNELRMKRLVDVSKEQNHALERGDMDRAEELEEERLKLRRLVR